MNLGHSAELTPVECAALKTSPYGAIYPPGERIATIVVDNFPALGRLAAMRFLEWIQQNPEGVVSLPTGKTPEHFIKWVNHLLATWHEPATKQALEDSGIDPARKPDMRGLHFVQIDEFYPINPLQENSFYHYVNRFYVEGFGLDPGRALLMDCSKIGLRPEQTLASVWPDNEVCLSLRYRAATTAQEAIQKDTLSRIDQWCQEYEERIRGLGGIGFFLGGIGPDGHIGFNVRGSDHHSTTRLTNTNYETQAAAAVDLGGIEISRKRLVITIGLGTIAYNPDCTALIIAAGAAKAGVVADAVQNAPDVRYPGTALHALPNARFYLTRGAARLLHARQLARLSAADRVSEEEAEQIVIDLAVARRKRLVDLTLGDFTHVPFAASLLHKVPEDHEQLAQKVADSLINKIEAGASTLSQTRFFHTEPHHDDLMLGCLPYIVRHVRDATNTHYFATLTSGFTSVSNHFMQRELAELERFIGTDDFAALMAEGYFDLEDETARNRDVWQCLDGIAAGDDRMKAEGAARRMLRDLAEVFDEQDMGRLRDRIQELQHYFRSQYPGKKDPEHIQRLKGMRREWEAECLWGHIGWRRSHVMHLRLGFYTGDVFTQEPTVERDVSPIVQAVQKVRPDVVTLALDPEASGPDTHYKVLQAITEALRLYQQSADAPECRVVGYRNVWYRFHPSEANVYVPISLNMFSILQSAFMDTFSSQKDASFPSYEHDGPFCELAQQIQVEQYQTVKTCLGREWFHEHPSALIRATRGLVFLKEMSLAELHEKSRELRRSAENR